MHIVPSHKWLGYCQLSLSGQKPRAFDRRKNCLPQTAPPSHTEYWPGAPERTPVSILNARL
jgi:hypothetical protein